MHVNVRSPRSHVTASPFCEAWLSSCPHGLLLCDRRRRDCCISCCETSYMSFCISRCKSCCISAIKPRRSPVVSFVSCSKCAFCPAKQQATKQSLLQFVNICCVQYFNSQNNFAGYFCSSSCCICGAHQVVCHHGASAGTCSQELAVRCCSETQRIRRP